MGLLSFNWVTQSFGVIGEAITAFGGTLVDAVPVVQSLFHDGTNITFLGTLMLVSVGVGIVYWAFGLVRSFIRIR
jgi:hypothetical protein